MSYLLDTCVISELSKDATVASPDVLKWLRVQAEDELYLSVITLADIQRGIARLPEGRKRSRLELFFTRLRSRFAGRFLPIDEKVALTWGEIFALDRPLSFPDSLIAATALVHRLAVVTRNTSDISNVPVVNPWEKIA